MNVVLFNPRAQKAHRRLPLSLLLPAHLPLSRGLRLPHLLVLLLPR